MVSVLTSSVVDYGFETWSGATNYQTIKLVFVASLVGIHYEGIKAKTGWLGIGIMCPSGASCLPANCCFSELAL